MNSRTIQISFFLAMFGIVSVLGFFIFRPYLNILVMAATFAVIFYPLYLKTLKWFGGKRQSLAAITTILAVMIVVFAPLLFLGQQVFTEAQHLYEDVTQANQQEESILANVSPSPNSTIRALQERLQGFLTESTTDISAFIEGLLGRVINNLGDFFQGVAHIFLAIFLWFLAFFYFLRDGHRIKEILIALSPLTDTYDNEILNKLSRSVKSVIGGSLIVALIQGILAGIGFWMFGVPNPTIWGALTILTALIPAIGTAFVTLPAVAYLFLVGNTLPMLGLLIWSVLIVGGIDNILRPKLIERGIQLHPFIILLSVLGGISLFGAVGFLLGPLIITLFSEFLSIYRHLVLHKDTPV